MAQNDLSYVVRMATRLPTELRVAQVRGVTGVASHVSRGIRTEVRSATGGNMRLSGANNARIGIKWTRDLGGANPSITISPTGPIMLIEEDTPPHVIRPRKRGGKKALKFGNQFAAGTLHPGTKGKHPWRKGVAKSAPGSGVVYDKAVQDAIRRAMA